MAEEARSGGGAIELQGPSSALGTDASPAGGVTAAAIASGADIDDVPDKAGEKHSYFSDKSIFQKRPAIKHFDAVWQVR